MPGDAIPPRPDVPCRFCELVHDPDLLCAPARRILDALYERGQRFNMPTVEFPEPVPNAAGMFGEGTVLLSQFTTAAATLPVAGTMRPALIFSGLDAEGRPLPQWMYPSDTAGLVKVKHLVRDMADMAVRAAWKAR